MKPAPKVSVLVPVFNGEPYLRECLDSILAQDFSDMEILIGDDCSTDGSLALIKKYAARDPRIRVWTNPKNLGLSANFNCCLRAATGQFVKYVLQDDKLLSPAAVRLMVEALEKNPAATLAGSASLLLDKNSRVTGQRDYFKIGDHPGWKIIRRCLEQSANLVGEPTLVMFRREHATRGFDERYQQLVDLEMWVHLLASGNFFYLAETLCAFRQHATQATAINRQKIASGTEEMMLLKDCFAQPWFRQVITRRFLFATIYSLRKNRIADVREFVAALKSKLGAGYFLYFWLLRKFTQPFKKIARWFSKKSVQKKFQS